MIAVQPNLFTVTPPNWPTKVYDVIYADPPWQYGSRGPRSGQFAELDYETMTTDEIAALPVEQIAARDAALFLWFTGSFMPDALQVCEAWGFRFVRIDKVWAKTTAKGNRHAAVGPWGMSDCEFLLLGTRGRMCSRQAQRNQYVLCEEPYPGKHSEKPGVFRFGIEERFPDAPRLELFARKRVPSWDAWGNEV
jgi:DNA (cytosine-5)-methyltransferase 1